MYFHKKKKEFHSVLLQWKPTVAVLLISLAVYREGGSLLGDEATVDTLAENMALRAQF